MTGDSPPVDPSPIPIHHSLFLYSLSAAAGLYTLYYFAFFLIALNLLVLWSYRPTPQSPLSNPQSPLLPWLAANGAAFLLWSPWLSTFWRQMTEPPVPPWRGALDMGTAIQESLAALLVGQSPPLGLLWPWALLTGVLLLAGSRHPKSSPLLFLTFAPLLFIFLISLTVTPLYHIRYFFTYAPVGGILLFVGLEKLVGSYRWLYAISFGMLLAINGAALSEFWANPVYRADDHRAAVTELAAAWRPGDALLINAGWVYTALAVYWPATPSPAGAQPLALPDFRRLNDYTNSSDVTDSDRPPFLIGGSVDGAARLGWGLAESDFYPITLQATANALRRVAERHPRIWHYRLYDTVSDPAGGVRAWLEENSVPRLDLPYPGRDFLRLQLFETALAASPALCPPDASTPVHFGDGVALRGAAYSPAPKPGSALYATLCWEMAESVAKENLRTSLRLYPVTGNDLSPVAQKDESSLSYLTTRNLYRTTLALPISAATPAGEYRLELILYDGLTGQALPIDHPKAIVGQRWPLADSLWIGP